MRRDVVSLAIARAVARHLPIAAAGLVACGGSIASQPLADAGNLVDGDTAGDATGGLDAGLPLDAPWCGVTSPNPVGTTTYTAAFSCGCQTAWLFPLHGTPAECGANAAGEFKDDAGSYLYLRCEELCPPNPADAADTKATCCAIVGDTLGCEYGPQICGTGRRPPGLRRTRAARAAPVARFLARSAHLEAASVVAFALLARELDAHGAPARLRSAARRAARDEARHARVVTALAERAGARVASARVSAPRVRPLEAIAVDNAVEGCVRETFGAAIATMQAAKARDAEVRAAMSHIARDETRHAELSWALAAWLDRKLDDAGRARVRQARDRAVRGLLRSAGRERNRELIETVGLPTAHEACAIAGDLARTLWA
jgi:hypothetical protein